MKDRTLQRLHNIDARFGNRIREAETREQGDRASFLLAFYAVRDEVIAPVFREIKGEIDARGHRAVVELGDDSVDQEGPSITLRVYLTARKPAGHVVSFVVIERGPAPQVLALLEATPPVTDLARYQPHELTRDVVEQVTVDALEHIYACIAELD